MVYLKGSCHCGNIRYVFQYNPSILTYRCNCTTCHKTSMFHLRPHPSEFWLLSPTDLSTLGDYTLQDGAIHMYFCNSCGVRCFSIAVQGRMVEKDVSEFDIDGLNGKHQAWQPIAEGPLDYEDINSYLSVNGATVDAGQEFDMIKLVDDKKVMYDDMLHHENPQPSSTRPHPGGCY